MSLYQDLRPKTLKEVSGNLAIKKSLAGVVKKAPEKRPHTFLFSGPSGCGKTTFARILASEFGCASVDLVELDSGKDRGVDAIRDMIAGSRYSPMGGACRFYIIDEAHDLPKLSQETLLKSCEDTPPHVYFALCSTDPDRIIPALRNRCPTYQVQGLRDTEMMDLITVSIDVAGYSQDDVSDSVLDAIVVGANGSPRKALVILEQVLNIKGEEEQLAIISNIEFESEVYDLGRAIIRGAKWGEVITIYRTLPKTEPEMIRRTLLGYFKNLLLQDAKNVSDVYYVAMLFTKNYYDTGEAGLILDLYGAYARMALQNGMEQAIRYCKSKAFYPAVDEMEND